MEATRREGLDNGSGEVAAGLPSSSFFSPSSSSFAFCCVGGKAGALGNGSPIAFAPLISISVSSLPILIIEKFGKSVSLSGGAGAEGEMVALRVGMGICRRVVGVDGEFVALVFVLLEGALALEEGDVAVAFGAGEEESV